MNGFSPRDRLRVNSFIWVMDAPEANFDRKATVLIDGVSQIC